MSKNNLNFDRVARGTVIRKVRGLDLNSMSFVHILVLELEDSMCQAELVVSEEMYNSSCIAGLGLDTVIEYGTVLHVIENNQSSNDVWFVACNDSSVVIDATKYSSQEEAEQAAQNLSKTDTQNNEYLVLKTVSSFKNS